MRLSIFLSLLLVSSSAFAIDRQPVDFSVHMVDLDGKDLPQSEKDPTPYTLAKVAEMALLTEPQATLGNRAPVSLDDKVRRFNLALRIHDGKPIALTAEETTLLKDAIGESFTPLIVGQAIKILDPAAVK